MATSTNKVLLCNMALVKLGKATITALTESTEEAQKCNLLFDETRMAVMAEGPWAFSIKRATLAQLSTTPNHGYSYQHQLPTDRIRILEINEESAGTYDYVIEGDKLLSDLSEIKIKYISDETDVTLWDPHFKAAFVLRLSAELSYYFRASTTVTQLLFQQYEQAVDKGLAIDGKQGSNERIVSPELNEVR